MSKPVLHAAESAEEIEAVRGLFRAYGNYLAANPAGGASICIENLDREIAGLPGAYFVLLLATMNEQPAGCVALKPFSREGERACELKRLWVSPSFRGHHLGRQLMQSAIDYAALAGFTALYLDTVPAAMPQANRLYEAFGFERVERYNENPVADVVFFRLDLSAAHPIVSGAENPGGFRNPLPG